MRYRVSTVFWLATSLVSGAWSPIVLAQYKCVVNGKTVYADAPCAPDAKHVGELQDQVSKQAEIDRLRQSLSEKQQRNRIEAREDAAYSAQQRAMQQQVAAEAAQARADDSAKRRRCANLQSDIDYNRQGVARYQDFGWQRQLTEQEQQLKRNREAYDRECR